MVEAYRRTQISALAQEYDVGIENLPLPHALALRSDFELRGHLERVIDVLVSLPSANDPTIHKRTYYTNQPSQAQKSIVEDVTVELLGMPLHEVQRSQNNLLSIIYFFLCNNTYFELIDFIYDYKSTHPVKLGKEGGKAAEADSAVKQFSQRLLYNL